LRRRGYDARKKPHQGLSASATWKLTRTSLSDKATSMQVTGPRSLDNMYYHAIATIPGDRRKSIPNKTEEQMLADFVIPFVSTGVIRAKWGASTMSYQVVTLRIYKTADAWDKKSRITLEDFIGKRKNVFNSFEKRAKRALGTGTWRCFVVMPIQGEIFGNQDQQRIHKEYDERFETIEKCISAYECAAIRIDKEHPLEDIVGRIKSEIKQATFVAADLTDERPSCYFEAGYAEALGKPIIYVASKQSIISPGKETKIHFDIHMNVNFFTNHSELQQKLRSVLDKNRKTIFAPREDASIALKDE
jgi:hypothetical protein